VVVNLPDKVGREEILKVHTRSVPLADDVNLGELAASTPGLSGADLRNLVNEAVLLAARREQEEVRQKDFLDALEKIVLGPERPLLMSPEERERIAYHEGGGIGTALTAFALDRLKEAGMTVAMVKTGGEPGHAAARRT
jgi:cell division protease FtsH